MEKRKNEYDNLLCQTDNKTHRTPLEIFLEILNSPSSVVGETMDEVNTVYILLFGSGLWTHSKLGIYCQPTNGWSQRVSHWLRLIKEGLLLVDKIWSRALATKVKLIFIRYTFDKNILSKCNFYRYLLAKTALTLWWKNVCTRNFAAFCFVQQQRWFSETRSENHTS